jgi:hypothetical protein
MPSHSTSRADGCRGPPAASAWCPTRPMAWVLTLEQGKPLAQRKVLLSADVIDSESLLQSTELKTVTGGAPA